MTRTGISPCSVLSNLILSIETSTIACSVALHNKGELIAEQYYLLQKSHSGLLPGIIDQLLSNSAVDKVDLAAIAISGGPGSYTGLRIGISTAKALAYGLQLPLISIPTLHVLLSQAMAFGEDRDIIVPMLDARRMEVYALFADSSGEILVDNHALILDETSFDQFKGKTISLVGNGAGKCRELFPDPNFAFHDDWYPRAGFMGPLAYEKFRKKEFEELYLFEPDYLKEFQTKKPKNRLLTQQ